MNRNQRIALIGVAIVVAVVAVIVIGTGGSDDNDKTVATTTTQAATTTTATTETETETTETQTETTAPEDNVTSATVRVVDAKPEGGVQTVTTKHNDTVKLTVVSDTADEIHVHGYDLKKDVKAGGQVTFTFKATIEGIFEAELEDHGEQIVKLVVEQ